MLAAGMKQTECVKLLLERGANRLATHPRQVPAHRALFRRVVR